MTERRLIRRQVRLRVGGDLVTLTALAEVGGRAIAPWTEVDDGPFLPKRSADFDLDTGAPKSRRKRSGWILVDCWKSERMTPAGWLIEDRAAAVALLGRVVDLGRRPGSLELEAMHREAGAWTGRWHALRTLDAAIDETEYARRLAGLRSASDRTPGVVARPAGATGGAAADTSREAIQ